MENFHSVVRFIMKKENLWNNRLEFYFFITKKINMLDLIKNPIVFGCLVGLILCILLYLNDKFFHKKSDKSEKPESKSSFVSYLKIFAAGFISSAPLVFLLFNRNLSFKSGNPVEKIVKDVIQDAGSSSFPDDISQSSVDKAVEAIKAKKIKSFKKTHTDMPNW